MGVCGADQDRIGGDAGACGGAFADVVGDADAEREQIDIDDGYLVGAVAEHQRLRGEVVVHAEVAADAAAVAEHRQADGRVELNARGACVEGAHCNQPAANSVALEATLAAAAMMSSMSRSSPRRHSCATETISCSNRCSATGQSIARLSGLTPASSQALR